MVLGVVLRSREICSNVIFANDLRFDDRIRHYSCIKMKILSSFYISVISFSWLIASLTAAERGTAVVSRSDQKNKGASVRPGKTMQRPVDISTVGPMNVEDEPVASGGVRRAIEIDGSANDRKDSYSSALLPNTMDGLNDKRPLGIGGQVEFQSSRRRRYASLPDCNGFLRNRRSLHRACSGG